MSTKPHTMACWFTVLTMSTTPHIMACWFPSLQCLSCPIPCWLTILAMSRSCHTAVYCMVIVQYHGTALLRMIMHYGYHGEVNKDNTATVYTCTCTCTCVLMY